jgi:putative SOS response-associated peptidase YedK
VRAYLELGVRTERLFQASFNVAPTQHVPVIRLIDGKLQGACLRWGLVPFFAQGEPPKYSTINARIETVGSGFYPFL